MWCEEIILVTHACIDVTHHDEEPSMFKKEVGIDIHYGIIAYLYAAVTTRRVGIYLHGILPDVWNIIRSIITCKIANIGTEIAMQHPCNLKTQVEIAIKIEIGQWESGCIA